MDRTRSYQPTATPTRASDATAPSTEDLPERTKARYEFLGEVARGGLGVVYEAIDRETGRHVAIKQLLRPTRAAEIRFRHEALTTARLEHPNIIPVYELGRWQESGQLFYAMKLVRGRSLKARIASARTLEARLALLPYVVGACDAVAHAHARRIVHRDLKPSNVLVGDFGETVVIDWGLAKDLDVRSEPPLPPEALSPRAKTHDSLTRTGVVLGTPAYMPPEQARGSNIDERADVYAVGAMLLHVLTGNAPKRTGSGSTPAEADDLEVDFDTSPVPGELAAIVKRATAPAADARYRTAGELAEELQRFQRGHLVAAYRYSRWELARRWVVKRRLALLAAAVVAASALAIASVRKAQLSNPAVACQVDEQELSGAWNASYREKLMESLRDSSPGAGRVIAQTTATIDGYAADWRRMATASCLATYQRRVQSERMFELRRRCLERRRADLRALVAVLVEGGDASTALPAAQSLPPLDYCANEKALTSARPPPAQPSARVRFDRALDDLAKAKALEDTGEYSAGEELARRVLHEHPGPEFAIVRALASLRLGWIRTYTGDYTGAREALMQAVALGSAGGDDDTVARAWSQTVFLTAQHLLRPTEARMLVPAARAAVIRAGSPPLVRAQLTLNIGTVSYWDSDFEAARSHSSQALELFREAGGDDYYKVAWALNNIAIAEIELGHLAAAETRLREAIEFKRRLFGPGHPDVGLSRMNLAKLLNDMLQFEESLTIIEDVLANYRDVFDDETFFVGEGKHFATVALCGLGRVEEGLEASRQAYAAFSGIGAGENVKTAEVLAARAACHVRIGNRAQANEDLERGLEILTRIHGQDSRWLTPLLQNKAALAYVAGAPRRAASVSERAARLASGSQPERRTDHGRLLLVQGLLRLGFRDEAIIEVERGLANAADEELLRRLSFWKERALGLARSSGSAL